MKANCYVTPKIDIITLDIEDALLQNSPDDFTEGESTGEYQISIPIYNR